MTRVGLSVPTTSGDSPMPLRPSTSPSTTPSTTRTLLPMVGQTHGNRSAVDLSPALR